MKAWKWILAGGVGVALLAVSMAWAVSDDVYGVKATLQGGIEYTTITNEVSKVKTNGITTYVTNEVVSAEIISVVMNSDDFVNLALGRDLGTKLPDNEVLAVTTRCGEGLRQLVVYDKNTTSILTNIGEFVPVQRAIGQNKHKYSREDIATLVILPAGSVTNAFIDGNLSADIQSELDTNSCANRVSATLIGWLTVIVNSNNYQTASNSLSIQPVLVRKLTLKTQDKKPIGTVAVAP